MVDRRNRAPRNDRSSEKSPSLPEREGVIVAHLGVAVEVRFADGEQSTVRVKRRSGHVTGDAVRVRGEVLVRLPRHTELRRRDVTGGVHLVGANLDVLGVVVAAVPPPLPGFLDRAIVAARAAGLIPFVVVNKCDLAAAELLATLRATYAGSVDVYAVSAASGEGLEQLRAFFGEGHRGAFVGTTGVGKSSLLNALCPQVALKVGALNEYTAKGCHTTTVSTLHALSDGGELVDTPGFQDFGLVEVAASELAAHFPGFEALQDEACRFRDCRHRTEPGCAIIARVEQGELAAERYAAYLQLLDEVEADEAEARQRSWKS